jgi:hypothetical protein
MLNAKKPPVRKSSAKIKGDALESAVRILESSILKLSPGYSEKTFHIIPNKIICVDGVHSELDIWIGVDIGNGYTASFIFECRNWKKKTNKNDVIVLIDKINAAQAQTGFFIAKSFTRDAIAKAKSNPRVKLLRVSEVDFSQVPSCIQYFHAVEQTVRHADCTIKLKSDKETGESVQLDLRTAAFVLDGEICDLSKYIDDWRNELFSTTANAFRSEKMPEGSYTLPFEEMRSFSDGGALLNGEFVDRITMSGRVELNVWRGELESRFEVETRGRVFRSVVRTSSGQLSVTAHELAMIPPQ